MQMPGRKYQASPTSKYRYSINGQEKSDELNENLTTAEYWEYDSRIGRRWNVDPVQKADESSYACFGNNPIWNIDPDGSDTAKYLSNGQLRDAMKIASNRVKDVLKNKAKFHSKQNDKALSNETDVYLDKNKLSFGASAEFNTAVQQYYEGLSHIAWWSGEKDFNRADRILNNPGVNDSWALRLIVANIKDVFGGAMSIITTTANVAVGEAAGAIGTPVGSPPKGVFKSTTQQRIVDAADPINGTYASRVRARGVQDPVSHNFPYSFDKSILSTKPIYKAGGYRIYQLEGTMNKTRGLFEIGVTRNGVIDHRFFRPFKK
jgi:RHS repeat-associated protein